MRTFSIFLLLALFSSSGLLAQEKKPLLAGKRSREAVALYHNLFRVMDRGIMFGHQDDLAYGVNWKYQPGRSDVREVAGDYPAVQGYELGHLELDSLTNLDSVPFNRMKDFIRTTYAQGGVITISWHLRNPLTGKTAWDAAPGTVASILPGGAKHEVYRGWLDKVAEFMLDLKGSRGEYIPVIFRPFHELNGNWFWWGKAHCTPEEYKQLFQFTVTYLRDTRKLQHLLYAYNTDRFASETEYMERYPGDAFVDVIGFDIYQRNKGVQANRQFTADLDRMLGTLAQMAAAHKKVPALTEFGFAGLPDSTWWTEVFWTALRNHKISFALAWRNAGPATDGFYVPFAGHASAADFKKMYAHPRTLFLREVAAEKVYQSAPTKKK